MKKIVSLFLAAVMLFGVLASFASCGQKDAEIAVYLGDQIYDLDPALAFVNDDVAKVLNLIYEPLFRMTAKGKIENALADDYEIIEDEERNIYKMEITLREAFWNDRSQVTADDIYFAWTRILDPEFESQAAPLLYDIKNAVSVKQGLGSRSDIGIEANKDTLTITFEGKIDYDAFLRNLCSIALVPLRETKVKVNEGTWAKKASSIATNGPFCLRTIDVATGEFSLQRNTYYCSATGETGSSDIAPSRIMADWTDENFLNGEAFEGNYNLFLEDQLEKFLDKTVFYFGAMPMNAFGDAAYNYVETRKQYVEDMEVVDLLSTYTYIFNEKNSYLADENVRKALSMAIDRDFLASNLVYQKAATGFISYGVWESDSYKDSFRSVGGNLISTTANIDEAKKLISAAGASGESFDLIIRDDPEELFIAEYVASQWEKIGIYVDIETVSALERKNENQEIIRDDAIQVAYTSGDYDILGIDYNMYSTNAFTALAGFTSDLNGNGVSSFILSETQTVPALKTHACGFSNAQYDELMRAALKEKDLEKRAQYLHDAEKILMDKMPIMPIVFNVNYYMTNSLGGLDVDGYGYVSFTNAKLK